MKLFFLSFISASMVVLSNVSYAGPGIPSILRISPNDITKQKCLVTAQEKKKDDKSMQCKEKKDEVKDEKK